MRYQLPDLGYSYDALEPYIDEKTMLIHHTKHHQGYINNLNKVLEKYPDLRDKKLEDLLKEYKDLPMSEKDKLVFKNNGGGHLNHRLFWRVMGPKKEIDKSLKEDLERKYGSLQKFRQVFSEKAIKHFGSGWAWLVKDENDDLRVYSLPNQDSPYLLGHIPIIGIDVWEHAYYLKYQNRRKEYVENWWKVLRLL